MAKKTSKKEKTEIELTDEITTSKINEVVNAAKECENNLSEKDVYNLKHINISDLILCEKACALICGKYENAARADYIRYKDKFNKYNDYYKKIFSELEYRIDKLCK
jgi:hypothetical protein